MFKTLDIFQHPDVDQGYAYVIMAACFYAFTLHSIMIKTSTIVYPQTVKQFDASATAAGLVSGIHGFVKMFSSRSEKSF